jgi:hypothetical protein
VAEAKHAAETERVVKEERIRSADIERERHEREISAGQVMLLEEAARHVAEAATDKRRREAEIQMRLEHVELDVREQQDRAFHTTQLEQDHRRQDEARQFEDRGAAMLHQARADGIRDADAANSLLRGPGAAAAVAPPSVPLPVVPALQFGANIAAVVPAPLLGPGLITSPRIPPMLPTVGMPFPNARDPMVKAIDEQIRRQSVSRLHDMVRQRSVPREASIPRTEEPKQEDTVASPKSGAKQDAEL